MLRLRRGPDEAADQRLEAMPCCASLEWAHEVLSGFNFWTAKPEDGTEYRIIEKSPKVFQCYLTTGMGHKFARPITDETDDFEAAKHVCNFHWHNSPAQPSGIP